MQDHLAHQALPVQQDILDPLDKWDQRELEVQ